jgi:hypothetical protein
MCYALEGQAKKAERIKGRLSLSSGLVALPRGLPKQVVVWETDQSFSPDAKSQKEKDAATSICLGICVSRR